MGTRLGGTMMGIGAGLAEGLGTATKAMTDMYKTDVEEGLANKRIDALNAQTELARNKDSREQEQWNLTKEQTAKLDEPMPLEQFTKPFSKVPGAADYATNVASSLNYVKDGKITRRDALQTLTTLKDPLHATELSKITVGHYQGLVGDLDKQIKGSGDGADIKPLLEQKTQAELALQQAKGRDEGLMKFMAEDQKRKSEEDKNAIEKAKLEKPDEWNTALKAAGGDAKKALQLVTEMKSAPAKAAAAESRSYRQAMLDEREETRKERAANGIIQQINNLAVTEAKIRKGIDPITGEMMSAEDKATQNQVVGEIGNKRRNLETYLKNQYPDHAQSYLGEIPGGGSTQAHPLVGKPPGQYKAKDGTIIQWDGTKAITPVVVPATAAKPRIGGGSPPIESPIGIRPGSVIDAGLRKLGGTWTPPVNTGDLELPTF